jgi:hypothetical protein
MRVEAQSPIAGSPEARASGSGSKRRFSDQDEIPFYASDIRLDTERDAGGSVITRYGRGLSARRLDPICAPPRIIFPSLKILNEFHGLIQSGIRHADRLDKPQQPKGRIEKGVA